MEWKQHRTDMTCLLNVLAKATTMFQYFGPVLAQPCVYFSSIWLLCRLCGETLPPAQHSKREIYPGHPPPPLQNMLGYIIFEWRHLPHPAPTFSRLHQSHRRYRLHLQPCWCLSHAPWQLRSSALHAGWLKSVRRLVAVMSMVHFVPWLLQTPFLAREKDTWRPLSNLTKILSAQWLCTYSITHKDSTLTLDNQ